MEPCDDAAPAWGFDSDEFSDAQLSVSVFQPHHKTRIFYPDLSLLSRDERGYTLRDPNEDEDIASQRYEPLPLIRDDAVEAHAGRENAEGVSFFTLTVAETFLPPYMPADHVLPLSSAASAFQRLLDDMRIVERFLRDTTLTMVTLMMAAREGEAEREYARVRRTTVLREFGGATHKVIRKYEFLLQELYRDPDASEPAWRIHLGELPLPRSDRTYRHVRHQLDIDGDEDWHEPCFKPRRQENVGRLLDSKLTPVDPNTLVGETCCVFTEDLDQDEAICLPCSGRCILHKKCLLTWVDSVGPQASCPLCRAKLLTDSHEMDDLRFGLVNGVYVYDNRFTAWENFERSCSDLDREFVENSDDWTIPNHNLITKIWDIVSDGACLETDEDRTMKNLDPLLFEEWDIADAVTRQQILLCNGINARTGNLFKRLLESVYIAFVRKFRKAGLHRFITPEEQWELVIKPVNAACLDIRPGFKECLERCLNRTLRFLELRKCDCSPGLHDHGARRYYNRSYTSIWTPAKQENNEVDEDGDIEMEDSC